MSIGGVRWQAQQAQQTPSYAQQKNREIVEANMEKIASFGDSLFTTGTASSQESVYLTLQIAAERIAAQVEQRRQEKIDELAAGFDVIA